ncbi:hypothetical protein [Streptomyces sp. DSM 40750]|uniref:hypothetical protein n=1 Tax=Streptomyces sp. DSM 40750 TaxID=2801030 RepID=UPI00214AB902|nr:hypothetical protein [Streptomyces sp. DSM 40750]UUU28415.1 hypothetical protein JIX55_09530 [Streptomyces sp. DSM 40750]
MTSIIVDVSARVEWFSVRTRSEVKPKRDASQDDARNERCRGRVRVPEGAGSTVRDAPRGDRHMVLASPLFRLL